MRDGGQGTGSREQVHWGMDVTVADMSGAGRETARIVLEGLSSTITLGELIRLRVRDEVARHNATPAHTSNDVEPSGDHWTGRSVGSRPRGWIGWEEQADLAMEAFERNGFFVFVGDRQITDVGDPLTLDESCTVSFVRLVPLVAG